MITVRCTWCQDWSLTASSGTGLLAALTAHQKNCPDYWGINVLKEKAR